MFLIEQIKTKTYIKSKNLAYDYITKNNLRITDVPGRLIKTTPEFKAISRIFGGYMAMLGTLKLTIKCGTRTYKVKKEAIKVLEEFERGKIVVKQMHRKSALRLHELSPIELAKQPNVIEVLEKMEDLDINHMRFISDNSTKVDSNFRTLLEEVYNEL